MNDVVNGVLRDNVQKFSYTKEDVSLQLHLVTTTNLSTI